MAPKPCTGPGPHSPVFSHLVQIKCDQYWPNRGTETYGFIQVTLLDTIELATFCVRTFSLHKVGPGLGLGGCGRGQWWAEKEYELLPWELPIGQKRNHIDPGWAHSQVVTLRMGTLRLGHGSGLQPQQNPA